MKRFWRAGTIFFISITALFLFFQNFGTNQVSHGENGFEVGGSNFATYDVSHYVQDNSLWYQPLILRPVIGTLHDDPTRVYYELAIMKANGQRKISLILWHAPLNGLGYDHVYGHIVDSTGGQLPSQQQWNLQVLMTYIQSLGFEEVQFRFAPQGTAHPGSWASGTWTPAIESLYQENWNFIVNTRKIIEETLGPSGIRRVYDLGVELAGLTQGQDAAYVRRLWSDYNFTYGSNDTYGFSFAVAPGRLTAYLQNLDPTGRRPASYAFDSYNPSTELSFLASEMKALGEINKSVLIQETYYNDAANYAQFASAKKNYDLNIRAIMQWPISRGSPSKNFSMDYPSDYYNLNPQGTNPSIRTSPELCTIASGQGTCGTTVSWDRNSPGPTAVFFNSTLFAESGPTGRQSAPWIGNGGNYFNLALTPGGTTVASAPAVGMSERGKLASSSSTNTCTLGPKGLCTLTIYWSVPGGTSLQSYVKVGGRLFAQGGGSGSGVATWIPGGRGVTFELYGNNGTTLLDSLNVHGVP